MFEIDNEKFGVFLSDLRKQKELTQKELAQKLFISDKAVSKWERGLSMPDIALLAPLSNILEVTVTELLNGERIDDTSQINVEHVEKLVTKTIKLSEEERRKFQKHRMQRGFILFFCIITVGLEIALLHSLGYTVEQLRFNLLTVELLYLIFGSWFLLVAKEQIPTYYDENKISFYSDGFFRMSIPGVYFNNSNWPKIVSICRLWTMTIFIAFPIMYLAISWFLPTVWTTGYMFFALASVCSIFVPIYITGKKYQ